jgi:FMN-dependent NADH-azoreductase
MTPVRSYAGNPNAARKPKRGAVADVVAQFAKPDRLLMSVPMSNFSMSPHARRYIDIVPADVDLFAFAGGRAIRPGHGASSDD